MVHRRSARRIEGPCKHSSKSCHYPNDKRTEYRPDTATANVHGTNTSRATKIFIKPAGPIMNSPTYLVHVEFVHERLTDFNEPLCDTWDTIAPRTVRLVDTVPLQDC